MCLSSISALVWTSQGPVGPGGCCSRATSQGPALLVVLHTIYYTILFYYCTILYFYTSTVLKNSRRQPLPIYIRSPRKDVAKMHKPTSYQNITRVKIVFLSDRAVIACYRLLSLERRKVPPNSLANRQKEFFDDAFSPFFRINQVGCVSFPSKSLQGRKVQQYGRALPRG